jgi:hydroxyacylglutathione hydrolase
MRISRDANHAGELVEDRQLVITQIPSGPIDTNAFLVVDPVSNQSIVIDAPPDVLAQLQSEIARQNTTPVALVLTHTHWDHIGDAEAIRGALSVPVLVHELEADYLKDPGSSPMPIDGVEADRRLTDGDTVTLGDRSFVVMHTPGHSPGQISLYSERDHLLIGGDTVFPNGYGRVDIPGASTKDTVATIQRLLELPDDVTVLTGHGASTTIGSERRWMTQVATTGRLFE